jgi:hypothetical protein
MLKFSRRALSARDYRSRDRFVTAVTAGNAPLAETKRIAASGQRRFIQINSSCGRSRYGARPKL